MTSSLEAVRSRLKLGRKSACFRYTGCGSCKVGSSTCKNARQVRGYTKVQAFIEFIGVGCCRSLKSYDHDLMMKISIRLNISMFGSPKRRVAICKTLKNFGRIA